MIITAEVLDRPKLSFSHSANPPAPNPDSDSLAVKRATSPLAFNNNNKKLRSSNTKITTYPRVTGGDNNNAITSTSIFITTPKTNSENAPTLRCDPFVVTTEITSPTIRVEHRPQKRKKPSGCETGMKESSEEWLARLYGKNKQPPSSSNNSEVPNLLDRLNAATTQNKNKQENSEHVTPPRKISVLNLIIGRRKSSSSSNDEISRNGDDDTKSPFKRAASLRTPRRNVQARTTITATPVSNNISKSPRALALSNACNTARNVSQSPNSTKRQKISVCSENEPKKFRGRDALSASVPPNLRKKTRNVRSDLEAIHALRNNLKQSSLNKENQDCEDTHPKSRKNSLTDVLLKFRRNSNSSSKRGSISSKRCSISGCSGKRPSITVLQDNRPFIDILRSRNNSLASEPARTRSNSLVSVVNIRPSSRNSSSTPKNNHGSCKSSKDKVAKTAAARTASADSTFSRNSRARNSVRGAPGQHGKIKVKTKR